LDTKIHPRRKPEDAKFGDSRGFIIDPPVDAESGKPEETYTVCRRTAIRGNPERRQSATPKDLRFGATQRLVERRSQSRRFGATRRFDEGTTGWCANRGDSGIHQPVPEDPEFGATRRLIVGDTEGLKTRGNLVNWSVGTAEGCESRGNSTIYRR